MADYTFIEMKQWLIANIPKIMNEKYFVYFMGSIFLLGVFTKLLAAFGYGRLIKKAENMPCQTKSSLRQIKMKYESIKEVNGTLKNPILFVRRHIEKFKIGIFSLKGLNNIINICIVVSLTLAVGIGFGMYVADENKTQAISYIVVGFFVGMVLDIIDRCVGVSEKKTELTYAIVDFLENSHGIRENSKAKNVVRDEELIVKQNVQEIQEEHLTGKNKMNQAEKHQDKEEQILEREEQILNQVIGEFMQ